VPTLITPDSPSPKAPTPNNPPNTPSQNIATDINAILAPTQAGAQAQAGQIGLQENLSGANVADQTQVLGTQLNQSLAGLGIQQGGLDISGQALQDQLAQLQANYGFQQQQQGLQGQSLEQQLQQAQFTYGQNVQGAQQNAGARGASETIGYGQQLGNLAKQYGFDTESIQRSQQQLDITKQQSASQEQFSEKGIAQGQKRLDLQYKQLGLSRDEVNSRYQNAINQLGLQNALTVSQLEQQLAGIAAGEFSPLTSILGQLMSVGAPIAGLFNGAGGTAPLAQGGSAPAGQTVIALQFQNGQYSVAGQPVDADTAWIIQHESSGNTTNKNKQSGAFGLGQLNPSSGTLQSIAKEMNVDPYTTDPATQLAMMQRYIKERYGTPQAAKAFWQAHNWY
jgi:hypothetical protein